MHDRFRLLIYLSRWHGGFLPPAATKFRLVWKILNLSIKISLQIFATYSHSLIKFSAFLTCGMKNGCTYSKVIWSCTHFGSFEKSIPFQRKTMYTLNIFTQRSNFIISEMCKPGFFGGRFLQYSLSFRNIRHTVWWILFSSVFWWGMWPCPRMSYKINVNSNSIPRFV